MKKTLSCIALAVQCVNSWHASWQPVVCRLISRYDTDMFA